MANDIDVRAVDAGEEDLPPFYRSGYADFMQEAQKRDPEHRHRWVNVSPKNQHLKILKGWEPVEDKTVLAKLGLDKLIAANGRARWSDTELWRMPIRRAIAIRKHIDKDTVARSQSARAAFDAMKDETKERSKGAVVPFIQNSGTDDLVQRTKVANVTDTK